MIGRTVAQYTILGKIGEGGMGEVWKARDTSLNREVAIKVLPEAFAQDAERLARFEREAMLLAGLDHPGLATVYGLHEENGTRYLAMELVAGADLAHRLASGPLPVQDALEIGVQVAAALEAAHDQGVVHRDLKPSNIMVTPEGKAKVLDFGLAFSLAGESDSSATLLSQSPTMAGPATGQGVILGTAAYMSPEQARGKPVDRRSDLWAFGCVLHEMLTGTMLFAGETVSDCVARILTLDPDLDSLPPDTPLSIRKLIRRCLTRDANQRQQGAGDARVVIEETLRGEGNAADSSMAPGGSTLSQRPRWAFPLTLVSVLAVGCLLGVLGWNLLAGRGSRDLSAQVVRLSVVFPADLRVDEELLSPDGHTLAIRARSRRPATPDEEYSGIYVRALDDFEFRFVSGSRGVGRFGFSADGRWLAMVAPSEPTSTRNFLWKVPVDGSAPPLKLMDWKPDWDGLHWLPDGDMVVNANGKAIVRIHTDGRPQESPVPFQSEIELETGVTPLAEHGTRLPDGEHLLSWVETWGDRGYSQDIVVANIRTGSVKVILESGSYPRWSPTGHLLFSRGASLLAVPFDPEELEVTGGPVAILDDLRHTAAWAHGWFDVSGNGTLIYEPGGHVGAARRLVWMDQQMKEVGDWSEERFALEDGPRVSPDGSRFAVVIAGNDGAYDIWMSATDRPILQLWRDEPGHDVVPQVWLPDGSGLVYLRRRAEASEFVLQSLDLSKPPALVFKDSAPDVYYRFGAFADDGSTLLGTRFAGDRRTLVSLSIDSSGGEPATSVAELVDNAAYPDVSPDGRWVVYNSDVSGRSEVYLRQWLGNGRLGPERRVSTDGGREAEWRQPAGQSQPEIWYSHSDWVNSVTVGTEENPALSPPSRIGKWEESYISLGFFPDGRLLMRVRGEGEGALGHVNLVPGWAEILEQR